jgi:hypothetical protein
MWATGGLVGREAMHHLHRLKRFDWHRLMFPNGGGNKVGGNY